MVFVEILTGGDMQQEFLNALDNVDPFYCCALYSVEREGYDDCSTMYIWRIILNVINELCY